MQTKDLQHETMRTYQALIDLHEDWSGKLVLCCGSGFADSGAPAAVSVATGALLAVDSDAAAMKASMRAGYLDFVVNTLDEAMRTLKNEVRQKRPLTVGLIAVVDATLQEVVERGIQPDLLLMSPDQPTQSILQNRSIRVLEALGVPIQSPLQIYSEPFTKRTATRATNAYKEVYLPAANAVELRVVDERLLAILPSSDLVRKRWIKRVPQYLRDARTGGRWIWLSEHEREQFDA